MSKLEAHDTAWTDVATVLEGNGAAKPKSAQPLKDMDQEQQRWQDALDHWLMEWARNPTWLEDEGIVAPAANIIQLASEIARDLRDAGVPGPHRVAATGDGGIVFVRQAGPLMSTLEVEANGSIELAVFRDTHLVSRQRLR